MMHKGRIHPDDTTLIRHMEAWIEHLDGLNDQALRLAVLLDWEEDPAVANALTADPEERYVASGVKSQRTASS